MNINLFTKERILELRSKMTKKSKKSKETDSNIRICLKCTAHSESVKEYAYNVYEITLPESLNVKVSKVSLIDISDISDIKFDGETISKSLNMHKPAYVTRDVKKRVKHSDKEYHIQISEYVTVVDVYVNSYWFMILSDMCDIDKSTYSDDKMRKVKKCMKELPYVKEVVFTYANKTTAKSEVVTK